MAVHGSISEFNPRLEDWTCYTERLEHYFIANGIKDDALDQRRAILLSVCGPTTYQLIRNLVSPNKPTDKTYAELVKLVKDHNHPPPSSIVARKDFHSRVRKPDESFSEYLAHLRKLSEHCDFGDTLNRMLLDRLVCGCNDGRLQCKLLAETDLTFDKAYKLALAMETAQRGAKQIQASASPTLQVVSASGQQQQKPQRSKPRQSSSCFRCGGKHSPGGCRFKQVNCNYCNKQGHIAKVCFSKERDQKKRQTGKPPQRGTHYLTTEEPPQTEYTMYHATSTSPAPKPLHVMVQVNDTNVSMEVDTGASFSVISEDTYNSLWQDNSAPPLKLVQNPPILKTYTGQPIHVAGQLDISVTYNGQQKQLTLLVIKGKGPSLIGRDWLQHLKLDWPRLLQVQSTSPPNHHEVLDRHPDVFKEEMGCIKGISANFHIHSDTNKKFYKARPVPYALRSKVEAELDRLERHHILERVQFSNWAAPIVPVVKQDGSVRICGDYKLTVNQAAKTDTYPLPRIEDLFASLSGGKTFSKLDLAHAYQQIPLDEESKEYTTINTHKGLYRYNRLPFGVASAPSIFQRTMENILQGIPHVCVYIDDILVTGTTDDDHLHNLEEVLTRLEKANLRLKRNKCAFLLPSVEYLGHRISAQGLQPTQEKIQAIRNAPPPQNVSQLKSFLGLLNYYCKFLPNLSSTLAPLYMLLQKNKAWCWNSQQQQAFQRAKESLTSDSLLVHYDPSKELMVACDASPYGVGAVLSHKMDDGQDKPIAFVSRSLAPAEKKYSQLDKEALAIIFGVKRFHQYLFGRHFTILSDHKPLQHLFNEHRATPPLASARIQRWALTLGAYDYSITYKSGSSHGNADMLSRLPLPEAPTQIPVPGETILLLDMLHSLPVTAHQIKTWTDRDPVLSRVRTLVLKGWQDSTDVDLKPYQHRKHELSVHDGCILWGHRVIVPPVGRTKIKEELHIGHPGASRMKSLARSFVWWPGMDQEIEDAVKQCDQCQRTGHLPAVAPLQPWEWPQRPWIRLHLDYAGPFLGRMFLILVDAHSKWIEVHPVTTATSTITIEHLRMIFATHGLPEMLVTDNGSVFTSSEFKDFTKRNGIRHVTSAPYHPASNGLAERAVQTFKENLRRTSEGTLETRISRFLFTYRNTPHTTTGVSPAELLLGRRPRTLLDLLLPKVSNRVEQKQQGQKSSHDKRAKQRTFEPNDLVFVRKFPTSKEWISGKIVRVYGPLSYEIELEDHTTVRRHIDHIKARHATMDSPPQDQDSDWVDFPDLSQDTNPEELHDPPSPSLRRSARVIQAPDRYGYT